MTGPDWRVYRTRPPNRAPVAARPGPDDRQLVAFARWVLALHQPRPVVPAQMPECSCGSALVLCPYRSAATRYLGPPSPS